jgi:hypothetical protein
LPRIAYVSSDDGPSPIAGGKTQATTVKLNDVTFHRPISGSIETAFQTNVEDLMSRISKRLCLVTAVATSFALAALWAQEFLKLQPVSIAAVTKNKLAANRLASNRLASNKLAANKLSGNALSSNRLEANLATAELLATSDGREVYSYLISCALPDGMTIEASVAGAPDSNPPDTNYTCTSGQCVFSGGLGLAEDWIDHKLSSKDERWVSACVFARVNLYVTAEDISLRGNHPDLAVSNLEAQIFTLEEGAFYGNLFTHEDDPIDWNACRGRDQAEGEPNTGGGLNLRDCAEEDPANPGKTLCGFNYTGTCADFTPTSPSPYACKSFDGTHVGYGSCHDTAGEGHWPKSRTYREVITVYVSN